MGIIAGPNRFGLLADADLRSGTNTQWNLGTYKSFGGPDDGPYIEIVGGSGGAHLSGKIEVDTTKSYQQIIYAKTISRGGANNSLAGGHIGFSCYDYKDRFIDLRNCGGIGNTTLSRDLNPGDTSAYITSSSGWTLGSDLTSISSSFRNVIIFPSTHPDYSVPYEYTRIGYGDFNIHHKSLTLTGNGDYELKLSTSSDVDLSFPNIGYTTPAGTSVSLGRAGGSFNYSLGNPNYPEEWTKYSSPIFTGESLNSSTPFRYATKYIKFLVLRNYNQRTQSPQDHVWGLSKFFFGQVDLGTAGYQDKI